MECPVQSRENAELLLAYCARRLDPETSAVLERHMESCAACRAFGQAQQSVWSALDAWEAVPVSRDFDQRLYARIGQEEHGGFWNRVVRPWLPLNLRPALSLALASAVVVVAFLVQAPTSLELSKQAQVETVDAEQVEKALDDLDMLRQLNLVPRTEVGASQSM